MPGILLNAGHQTNETNQTKLEDSFFAFFPFPKPATLGILGVIPCFDTQNGSLRECGRQGTEL
jgi:hypothetical protein